MKTREFIEKSIREAIESVSGKTNLSGDASLIDKELGIVPVDFLYIFEILADRLQFDIYKLLVENTYQVMTINRLADAIYQADASVNK